MSLRAKFLLALLIICAGLTSASLVIVRRVVSRHIRAQIVQDLGNSVATFENVKGERETNLTRAAELMADLPIVRALMTTRDPVTIQDGSTEIWKISGSDLLVLSDAGGRLMAIQSDSSAVPLTDVQRQLVIAVPGSNAVQWWLCGNRLFEVAVRPIYLGDARLNRQVGFIALGSEFSDKVARQLSQVAASEVIVRAGSTLIQSTLLPKEENEIERLKAVHGPHPDEISLRGEKFLAQEIPLSQAPPKVHLIVVKSLDQATGFLQSLDRLFIELGMFALAIGAALVWTISRTIVRPLHSLVLGVRALGKSDFDYPLQRREGKDEVAELTTAFRRMRAELQRSQRELLESERLATIGRMASSISHDLRHHLSAIFSNAEFLADGRHKASEREELYDEIRIAVGQMTDLVDSLMEFSRTPQSLRLKPAHVEDAIQSAVRSIQLRPEFRSISIEVGSNGSREGSYDVRKLERAFQNLLLNACEAVNPSSGRITIEVHAADSNVEIRVRDDGRGIPDPFVGRVFEPFFTEGKANGTGLGLTVAQKIVQDHGGDLRVESTSPAGTVFLVTLPLIPVKEPVEVNGGDAKTARR